MTPERFTRSEGPSPPDNAAVLARLVQHIGPRRRFQFALLLGLMLVSALADVVSLGAVLPFLGILTDPDRVLGYPLVPAAMEHWDMSAATDLVLPLTIAFVIAALVAGGLRWLLLWASVRLVYATGVDVSVEAYRRTLHQPFGVHVTRNSGDMISGIVQKVGAVTYVMQSFVTLIGSTLLFVAIMLVLLAVDAKVAMLAVVGMGAAYGCVIWLSRHRLERNSQRIAREEILVIKALQEGLGGIRDVILDGTQSVLTDVYRKADQALRFAHANSSLVSQSPRHAIETVAMVVIAILAYSMSHRSGGIGAAIPTLGALALGVQRLLPAMQQGYLGWATIAGSRASMARALEFLDQPLTQDASSPAPAPMPFGKSILLDGVWFRYSSGDPWVLHGLSLSIPKGTRIGIVGATGSGKSTMLDLLMLLLEPTQGRILVDDETINSDRRRAWQRTIAHVPQAIFLADATVAENIAFGVPPQEIDLSRVKDAARRAQISSFIEDRPEGYQALVGERGIRLSGGQRQRIAIARALYKQAAVLVLDEATSSLDDATERAVMDVIDSLGRDLTIVIVAHRLSTVRRCDTIVEMDRGRVVVQGSYEQLVERRSGVATITLRHESE